MTLIEQPPNFAEALAITLKALDETLWVTAFESDPETVVELSKTDPKYFEGLRLSVGALVIENKPLPDPYRKWLYAFLYDAVVPPKQPAGRRKTPLNEEMVIDLVSDLVELGMQATRNDATTHNDTACDAVAAALRKSGKQPQSYDRVKKIWLKLKKNNSTYDVGR